MGLKDKISLSLLCEDTARRCYGQVGSELLPPSTHTPVTLMVDFPVSKNCEEINVCGLSHPSLWCLL